MGLANASHKSTGTSFMEESPTSPRHTCPCEFGDPCNKNCTCANPGSSYGCTRCCRYGSLEQRAEAAKAIIKREKLLDAFHQALKFISTMGGNLSDEALTSKTGPNDAVQRGILYTGSREVANKALDLIKR